MAETKEQPKEKGDDKKELKKVLDLKDLILFGLCNVVGAGVFVVLGKTILYGGKYIIPIFILIACLSLIMGFCYLEIYSRYKSEITEYLAIKNNLGTVIGQISLYMLYLFAIFSSVTITLSLMKYVTQDNGYFTLFFDNTKTNERIFSVILITIMCVINYFGIDLAKVIANSIATVMLVLIFGIIFSSVPLFNIKTVKNGPSVPWHSFVLATVLTLFLFNGYDAIVKMTGETINPADTSTAIISTIVLTSVIYLFIITSCVCVLGYKTTSKSYHPLSAIYDKLFGHNVGLISYICAFIIMFNSAFLSLLGASRFMYGCGKSKDIDFPEFWTHLSEHQTPTYSIMATLVIAIIAALINSEVILAVFTNFSVMFILTMISLSLLVIRWKERNDIKKQQEHNYLWGNINNIPVLVIFALILILFLAYNIVINKFYLDA
jgi:APA family basic amino acid/polyamine antiporter